MERVAQYADPMLLVTAAPQQSASSQAAKAQSADRSDFGKMVRQKQQKQKDSGDGQKTQKQDGKDTQSAQKPQEGQGKPKGVETEITDNQYMLASLLLQIGVPVVQEQTAAEETAEVQVQEDVWMPQVEAVVNEALPVVREETDTQVVDAAPELRQEIHETYRQTEHEAVRRMDGPVAAVQEEQAQETEIEITDVAEAAQPVFGPVTAAPVKVAENTLPVDTQGPDPVREMGSHIENFLIVQEEGGRVEFTLIPESLGKISVEISRDLDGALHIQLTPSTLRAAEFLSRNSDGLQHLLGRPGRPETDVEVRNPQNTENPFLNPNAQQQEEQRRQQGQQQRRRREERHEGSAQDFIQQLRLGLVTLD